MRKEACVLFSTGYQTNEGSIQTIAGRNDVIFSDKDNHACIVVGTLCSSAKTVRYHHNDMDHLRKLLEREDPDVGKIIISDGVFSMSGTLAKIPELVELAKEFGARLYLDDAHAIGVIGEQGRGSASVFGLVDEVDLISEPSQNRLLPLVDFWLVTAKLSSTSVIPRPRIFSAHPCHREMWQPY